MTLLGHAARDWERDAKVAANFDNRTKPNGQCEPWPVPTPLPDGLPPVPEFDYELLPAVMRRRVEDIADRMQCPPDFPAVSLMVMLSSVVGRRCGVHPKRHDDWLVIPNLWGMTIGRPGIMKTPAVDEALKGMPDLPATGRGVSPMEP